MSWITSLDLSQLSVPAICTIGTVIGLLHALSGPDHLAGNDAR